MSTVDLVLSVSVYIALMLLFPSVLGENNNLLIAWAFVTTWFALYLSFKFRIRRKGSTKLRIDRNLG